MAAALFMILFWLGFERVQVRQPKWVAVYRPPVKYR